MNGKTSMYTDPFEAIKQEKVQRDDYNRRRHAIQKEEQARPSSADSYAEIVERMGSDVVNKVSRLVAQSNADHMVLANIDSELYQARLQRSQTVSESDRQILGHPSTREEAVKKTSTQLKIIDERIAFLESQRKQASQRSSVSLSVKNNVLEALQERIGGGAYTQEIFETMGWR